MSSPNRSTDPSFDFDDMAAEEQALLAGERAAERYDALPESNNIYDDFDILLSSSEKNTKSDASKQTIPQQTSHASPNTVEKPSEKVVASKATNDVYSKTESAEPRDPNERPELILIDVSGFLFKQYEGRKSSAKKDPVR